MLGVGLFLFGIGLWHISPGIQDGDNGDFQLACATLGIAHPPGYVGYAFVGWLWTKVLFWVDPAYAVQLGCLTCVVGSLMIACALLIRAGCHALLACAIALLPIQHPWFWHSVTCAEVYAPSLFVLALVVYLFCTDGRPGRAWRLYLAAGLYGFLVINRPPALLFLPGIVAALIVAKRRLGCGWKSIGGTLAAAAGVAALAGTSVLVLTLLLEDPATPYNYVAIHEASDGGVPIDDGTFAAAVDRLVWLVTAQQYDALKGANVGQMRSKLRWIRRQLFVYDARAAVVLLLGIGLGMWALWKSGPDWPVLLLGVVAGSIAFQVQYRVHDFASDLLPVIWALVILLGAYAGRFVPARARGGRRIVAGAILVAMAVWVVWYAGERYNYGEAHRRERFLAELRMSSLPEDAVIVSDWNLSVPLLYEKLVRHARGDVTVIGANDERSWAQRVRAYLDRPAYYTEAAPAPAGYDLVAERNVYRLVRRD